MRAKKIAWGCALTYWVIGGLIPIALLHIEYGDRAITYATIYGHFFLYPIFFGWIPALIVGYSFKYIYALLGSKRQRQKFWLGLASLSLIALTLEIHPSNSNIAPWEVKHERLESLGFNTYFDSSEKTEVEKSKYQETMLAEIRDTRNWSKVRYAYFASFFVQAGTLLTIFFYCVALLAYRVKLGLGEPYLDQSFRGVLSLVTTAASICLLYSLARMSFTHEKIAYFPSISNEASTWVLLSLFIAAITFLSACLYLWIGKHLQPILTLVFGGSSFIAAFQYPEVIYRIFGKKSGLLTYFTIAAGMLVFYWAWSTFAPPTKSIISEEEERFE